MHFEGKELVFNTGKRITVHEEMFFISENGVFRVLTESGKIEKHKLTVKEIREVINYLFSKIDNLNQILL